MGHILSLWKKMYILWASTRMLKVSTRVNYKVSLKLKLQESIKRASTWFMYQPNSKSSTISNHSKVSNLQTTLKLDNPKVFESQAWKTILWSRNLLFYCLTSIPLNSDCLRNNPHNYLGGEKYILFFSVDLMEELAMAPNCNK